MHILIRETLSFNLIYVTACYPVGTTISKTSSLFTALLQHYKGKYMHMLFVYNPLNFNMRGSRKFCQMGSNYNTVF